MTDPAATAPVIQAAEAQAFPGPAPEGSRFGAQIAPLGQALRLTKLGCMVITVEPGMRAFPFHAHHANDELFVILEGEGELRLGDAVHPVRSGDVVGCPAGTAETAHQIVNTGAGLLRYVGVSSALDPDVVEYPDSGKFAVISIGPGRSFFDARLKFVGREDASLDYWDGEA